MRIKDLKIRNQLAIGNGLIISLLLGMSVLAYFQSKRIIRNLDDLYNHPYTVGKATRDINTNCATIHSYMKNIVFEEDMSPEAAFDIEFKIQKLEQQTYELFDLVYERYLGEKVHIDSAYKVFTDWKVLRDKLIYLKQHNLESDVLPRYRLINQPYVDKLMKNMQVMVDFAGVKASDFQENAMNESRRLILRMSITVFLIILLILLINYYFIRGIYEPLGGLTKVADKYRLGDYNHEYIFDSKNELGIFAATFQKMASTFRKDLQLKGSTADLAFALQAETDLKTFSKTILLKLSEATNSQVVAFYLLDPDAKLYKHFDSLGMSVENSRSFSSEIPDGEFGVLITGQKIGYLRNIPDDTKFMYSAVTGQFKPREIISIPIVHNSVVIAVLSLATVSSFSSMVVQWLNDIWPMLTARINGVIAAQKIHDFSLIVDNQNKELGEKNRELSQQTEELKEYNLELNIQKKQLDQISQLKTSFLSNMSHELRTPLNSVIALSTVLIKRLRDRISEEEYKYIEIIEKNGKGLLSLINNILDLSRIESGKEILTLSTISPYELVESIIENLTPQIQERNIKIINKISPEIREFVSDRIKCNHIFQNIIQNAVKFTEHGKVEIAADVEGDELVITVSDTGIGIEPEKLSMIFDEFRQADEKSSRKFGGTGLGLAIARKYSIMLSGNIEVESKPGIGSKFTITLPLELKLKNHHLENSKIKNTETQDNLLSEVPDYERTILIVEDSEAAIVQMCDILQEYGFNYLVARDGKEALDMITRNEPDGIILDLMMPGTDGFETLNKIRSFESTKTIPVLILTAKHVSSNEQALLKRNSISQLIQKGSIRKEELHEAIRNMFRKKIAMTRRKTENRPYMPGILVIEDNADNMTGVRAILQDKYTLYEASDGKQGLELARTKLPDIILLDISLPGMDGFAVLDELKKNSETSGMPVIALTARALTEDRERFLSYGFDGFVSKPVDSEVLETTIRNFLMHNNDDKDPGH